jgi:hypothetical protein
MMCLRFGEITNNINMSEVLTQEGIQCNSNNNNSHLPRAKPPFVFSSHCLPQPS